jgi:HlyD family secretion protein
MMARKRIGITIALVVAAVATLLIVKALSGHGEAPTFTTAAVERGNLELLVSTTGTLDAVGTVEVGSQASGTIEKVFVDYNDSVRENQILAVLETDLLEASVKDAEANLLKARAQLKQAEADYKRNLNLHEKGYLSVAEFIAIETSVEYARAGIASAEASLERAETNLEHAEIRSPIDGTVIERAIEPGQTIAASLQSPRLFLIAEDLTRMEIEADVDESDIGMIEVGQQVRFTVEAHPDETFSGKVRQIQLNPQTIQNVVHYTVVVDSPNQEYLLLPGMTATVDFVVFCAEDVLLLPNSALNLRPPGIPDEAEVTWTPDSMLPEGASMVLSLDDDGNPVPVVVRTGETNGVVTEVSAARGLGEGTVIITGITEGDGESAYQAKKFPFGPPRGGRGMHPPGM